MLNPTLLVPDSSIADFPQGFVYRTLLQTLLKNLENNVLE
jgi:hypothetical protein